MILRSHLEARCPAVRLLIVRGPVGRSMEDEMSPVRFDSGHVLDQPAEAQLTHCRALSGLFVRQVAKREAQKVPVLPQRLEEVRSLGRVHGLIVRRHRVPFSCR